MTFQTMKMQLVQTVGLKAKAEYILDLIIQILLELKDFSVFHVITFGETILLALTIFRAVWYAFFGVSNGGNYDYYFSEFTWIFIFVGCSLAHLGSFFFKNVRVRCVIILVYAVIWTFLGMLAFAAGTTAPAVPTFAVFALASIYLAVRLWHENK